MSGYAEFGVSVPLVLLFGSYLRREPEAGDIDIVLMTIDRPNVEKRREELAEARVSRQSFFKSCKVLINEVRGFLKNRSSWIAVHSFSDALSLNDLAFSVIHADGPFEPIANDYKTRTLSAEEFLKRVEELRGVLHRETWRQLS